MIFVNSMSDLFHDAVPEDYISAVAKVMVAAKWHTYQVLTKRSERLKRLLNSKLRFAAEQPHIWWGVSVEDKKYGVPRVTDLQKAKASVRFLSVEPLLEDLGALDLDGIGWVIVGGESGPGARPLKKEWVVSLRDQCRLVQVPFFFKQWGGVRKIAAGRELDGRTYDEFPGRIQHPVLAQGECSSLAQSVELPFKNLTPVECLV
jgi:protein gp37